MSILKEDLDININFGEMCEMLDVTVKLDTYRGGCILLQQMQLKQKHQRIISGMLKSSIAKINSLKPSGHDIKRCIADVIHCKANTYNVHRDRCVFDIDVPLHIFYTINLAKNLINLGVANVPIITIDGEMYRVMEIRVSAKLRLKSPQSDYIF